MKRSLLLLAVCLIAPTPDAFAGEISAGGVDSSVLDQSPLINKERAEAKLTELGVRLNRRKSNEVVSVSFSAAVLQRIEPQDWQHLQYLPELKTVFISKNETLTDAHVVALSQLTHVQRLMLRGAKITDGGLFHLREMKKLKFLYVPYKTMQATKGGLEELKKALPECKIVGNGC